DMGKKFPFIRNLPYLIYILQKVIQDMGRDVIEMEIFERHLDEMVGGSFDYSIFGLTVFSELIYHQLVVVVDKTINDVTLRINSLITEENCRLELLRGYLAEQVYNYVLKNGPTSYRELYQWVDRVDSPFLHDQFPKWKKWGEKEKIEDFKAHYKSHWEIFVQSGKDSIDINPSFDGLVASHFID
ncbi:hypothetical protein PENTCL1PPCAC_30610, partial [Pristionchus entomophagus]